MTTRKELVEALRVRYRGASFGDRIKILNEFVALTGYHRKHAIRVLREQVVVVTAASVRNRVYDEAVLLVRIEPLPSFIAAPWFLVLSGRQLF